MNIIEIRLTGHQATMADVGDALAQALAHHKVSRVVLHYSQFSLEPLSPQLAEQVLTRILRQRGLDSVVVTVQARSGNDQYTWGEHILHLHLLPPSGVARQFELAPGLPACMGRFLSRYFTIQDSVAPPPSEPLRVTSLASGDALAILRRAVGLAVAYGEVGVGSTLRLKHDAAGKALLREVNEVQLVVRQGHLHQALAPLMAADQGKAQQFLKPMLQAQGLVLATGFRAAYRYQPWCVQDGNASAPFPTELDLQVQLRMTEQAAVVT